VELLPTSGGRPRPVHTNGPRPTRPPPNELSVHPGDILRNDFLEPLGLTAYRLAKELGVSRPTVTQLVARRRSVTAEMALRLARYFGTSARVWQNLQAQYDLEVATMKIGKAVNQKIRPRSTVESSGPSEAA
jgi:addiction module HigA family antidote